MLGYVSTFLSLWLLINSHCHPTPSHLPSTHPSTPPRTPSAWSHQASFSQMCVCAFMCKKRHKNMNKQCACIHIYYCFISLFTGSWRLSLFGLICSLDAALGFHLRSSPEGDTSLSSSSTWAVQFCELLPAKAGLVKHRQHVVRNKKKTIIINEYKYSSFVKAICVVNISSFIWLLPEVLLKPSSFMNHWTDCWNFR